MLLGPPSGAGLLYHSVEPPLFLGTCFAFRLRTHFLTAAHCIGRLTPKEIRIVLPNVISVGGQNVETIVRHPTADLAVLVAAQVDLPSIDAFTSFGPPHYFGLGQDFVAYGFPDDVFGETMLQPTARMFRGSIQRFMRHKSRHGYEYDAVEMSIGAPAGLSGGPLFMPEAPFPIIGLVTENLRSTTFLQSVSEIQEGDSVYKETVHEMINYGVALELESLTQFLDQYIPATLISS